MNTEKIDKLRRLLEHVLEQAQRHHFLNAVYTVTEIQTLLLQGLSQCLKCELPHEWGPGIMFDDVEQYSNTKGGRAWAEIRAVTRALFGK